MCLSVLFWTGSNRFYDNIEDMIGYRPLSLIKWCWKVVTPGICAVRARQKPPLAHPPTFPLQSPKPAGLLGDPLCTQRDRGIRHLSKLEPLGQSLGLVREEGSLTRTPGCCVTMSNSLPFSKPQILYLQAMWLGLTSLGAEDL